jgi:hypothetical protein
VPPISTVESVSTLLVRNASDPSRKRHFSAVLIRKWVLLGLVTRVRHLSPSTRRIDLMLKRSRYESAGCRSYWVVDQDVPSIIAWELRNGVCELVGEVAGDDSLSLERPYPVTVVPARLFD